MQAFSYAEGRLLNAVANAVVNRRLRFDPDPEADPEELVVP
jgi:hypothetical protein